METQQPTEQTKIRNLGSSIHILSNKDRQKGGQVSSAKKAVSNYRNGLKALNCKDCKIAHNERQGYCEKHMFIAALADLSDSYTGEDFYNLQILCLIKLAEQKQYLQVSKNLYEIINLRPYTIHNEIKF